MGGCCASEGTGTQNDRLNDLGKLDKGKDGSMMGKPTEEGMSRKKKYSMN